jgi:hypothetical protein
MSSYSLGKHVVILIVKAFYFLVVAMDAVNHELLLLRRVQLGSFI